MIDFWYTNDNVFLFKSTFKIRDDITKVDPYDKLLNLFYYHVRQKAINTGGNKKDLENENHIEFCLVNRQAIDSTVICDYIMNYFFCP